MTKRIKPIDKEARPLARAALISAAIFWLPGILFPFFPFVIPIWGYLPMDYPGQWSIHLVLPLGIFFTFVAVAWFTHERLPAIIALFMPVAGIGFLFLRFFFGMGHAFR
ncbi:hypothetical protein [Luteolibacter soli]|uniref:Uncharacterized protein n=1 Tax=Luteolibacter soli TaxID=3135280 RepID=A0ABU9AXE3_9BACT